PFDARRRRPVYLAEPLGKLAEIVTRNVRLLKRCRAHDLLARRSLPSSAWSDGRCGAARGGLLAAARILRLPLRCRSAGAVGARAENEQTEHQPAGASRGAHACAVRRAQSRGESPVTSMRDRWSRKSV